MAHGRCLACTYTLTHTHSYPPPIYTHPHTPPPHPATYISPWAPVGIAIRVLLNCILKVHAGVESDMYCACMMTSCWCRTSCACMMVCSIKECYKHVGNVAQIKFETIHSLYPIRECSLYLGYDWDCDRVVCMLWNWVCLTVLLCTDIDNYGLLAD